MAVDPITGGLIGWVCGKLGDKVLKHLVSNRELVVSVERAVAAWAESLPEDMYVDPHALYASVNPLTAEKERPEYCELQGELVKRRLPGKEVWHGVFMESWEYVKRTVSEPQALFLLSRSKASAVLDTLADATYDVCVQFEPIFKATVIRKLDGIEDKLDEISEQVHGHADGESKSEARGLKIATAKLPVTGHELFGREQELAGLDEAWGDEHTHILSLVAWGGVGKTALVNEWLNRMEEGNYRGAKRVFGWSFYSQGTREERQVSGDEFLAYALKWFGDADPAAGSPWDKGVRLAELVRSRKTLLILDGLEPLQYPPGAMEGRLKDQGLQALVKELASSNDGLCVITTREAVKDIERSVGGTVKRVELEDLSVEAGVELLKSLGVKGTEKELGEAVKDFGGHALALNLLGTYLDAVHEGEIRKRDLVPHLTDEEQQGGHAKRVMESYENWLKGTPELDILYLMGLFDRPAPGGAITALREEPAIEGLTDKLAGVTEAKWKFAVKHLRGLRLLGERDEGDEGKLDCHPLIREHFGEKLEGGNADGWREAHGRLYEYYKGVPEKDKPDTLEEMEPLYCGVAHACCACRFEEALELYIDRIQRGTDFFNSYRLGAFGAGLATLSGFFQDPYERLLSGLSMRSEAAVYVEAGYCLRALGQPSRAMVAIGEALGRYELEGLLARAADCAYLLSRIHLTVGDLRTSLTFAKRSLQNAEASGNSFNLLCAHSIIGDNYLECGDLSEAERVFKEVVKTWEDLKDEWPVPYSLPSFTFCELLMAKGEWEKARKLATRVAEVGRSYDCLPDIAWEHVVEGVTCLLRHELTGEGDIGVTERSLDKAVEALRRSGLQDYLAKGLMARGEMWRYRGRWDKAWVDLEEAREIAERGEMRLWLADCCLEGARLCLAQAVVCRTPMDKPTGQVSNKEGRTPKVGEGRQRIVPFGGYELVLMGEWETLVEARKYFEEARSAIDDMGYHRRDPEILLIEAEVLGLEGEKEEGKKMLDTAKARIDDMGCHRWDSEVERLS